MLGIIFDIVAKILQKKKYSSILSFEKIYRTMKIMLGILYQTLFNLYSNEHLRASH